MAHVVVLDSRNEDLFVCGLCKLVFNSLHLFIDHKKLHYRKEESYPQDNQSLPCFINVSDPSAPCNNQFSRVSALETQACDVSCTLCDKKFKSVKCLHAHLKSHEKSSQCTVCGRCFINNSSLKRHITTHKVWPNGLNETTPKSTEVELLSYSCLYCDSVLSNYSQYRAHLNSHMSLKMFKCIQGECDQFLETFEQLLNHISFVHTNPKYTCHICKKEFSSLEDIGTHHRIHHASGNDAKPMKTYQFKCSLCDATFRKPEKLSLHMLTESHNKVCIHCNRTFASDKRLRMHLQIHKKSKPYQCTVCNNSFLMKKYLTAHMLKHSESQFTCNICKHMFKRQDVLQRHMKSHSLKKKFKCPFQGITKCMKDFSRRDKLKDHLKSHMKSMRPSTTPSTHIDGEAGTLEICIVPLNLEDMNK